MFSLISKTFVGTVAGSMAILTWAGMMPAAGATLRLTVVFNNVPFDPRLTTSWGFACLVQGTSKRILFDTGGNADILLGNLERLRIDPGDVDVIVLSHIHADHTGGLEGFLRRNPQVTVYVPESFPSSFQQTIKGYGARVMSVGAPTRLFGQVYSSGEMGGWIREQALIIDGPHGLVIITGCAHPGIVDVVKKSRQRFHKDVYLLLGGFHLGATPATRLREIVRSLKKLGVKKVAPSHCTGEQARKIFRQAWGDDFLEGGLGAVIELDN